MSDGRAAFEYLWGDVLGNAPSEKTEAGTYVDLHCNLAWIFWSAGREDLSSPYPGWRPMSEFPADDDSDTQVLIRWKEDALAENLYRTSSCGLLYGNRNKECFRGWMPIPEFVEPT